MYRLEDTEASSSFVIMLNVVDNLFPSRLCAESAGNWLLPRWMEEVHRASLSTTQREINGTNDFFVNILQLVLPASTQTEHSHRPAISWTV